MSDLIAKARQQPKSAAVRRKKDLWDIAVRRKQKKKQPAPRINPRENMKTVGYVLKNHRCALFFAA